MEKRESKLKTGNPEVLRGHEFEALRCLFESQVEQLHRLTQVDLRVFIGYLTLQLAVCAWIAKEKASLASCGTRIGFVVVDFVIAFIACVLVYNSHRRRKEVAAIVKNCNLALGYETEGIYLVGAKLAETAAMKPGIPWYWAGIAFAFLGVVLITFLR